MRTREEGAVGMKESPDYNFSKALQEMREEYWRSLEEAEQENPHEKRDYLIFALGGERFGIPIAFVREVVRSPRMIRVPKAPPRIAGVINLRGAITAVTDLRDLLGLSAGGIAVKARLVIVEGAGITTALLTDRVDGLCSFAEKDIEPPTVGVAGIPRDLVEGQVADAQGLVVLLRMERILQRPDMLVDQKGE